MKMRLSMLIYLCLSTIVYADVVINEINYNPPDVNYSSGTLREFIELYNPGSNAVDLSGYQFTKGITYTFPQDTVLTPGSFLVLVRATNQTTWRGKTFTILGPYEGELANGGERLELARPDGTVVESFKYNDKSPWTQTTDGYGATLERISWDLPADDFHSWRASLWSDGTPGQTNSVVGAKPRPVITSHEIVPQFPTSKDTVTVRFGFDAASVIDSATLQWEKASQGSGGSSNEPAMYVIGYESFRYWKGREEPSEGDLWTKPEFDDSSWLKGNGLFGYGDSQMISTNLSDMKNNYASVYLRQNFVIPDADTLKSAYLYVFYSGGFTCYLNGIEVATANVPESATHATLATKGHSLNDPDLYVIENTNGLLKNGQNTIALMGTTFRLNIGVFGLGVFLLEGERTAGSSTANMGVVLMNQVAESVDGVTFEAQIPPQASQTLIRFNTQVGLKNKTSVILPYVTELRPFESYFVYDGELKSLLPILWPYYSNESKLTEISRMVSGAIILPASDNHPLVFDGAFVYSSRNGQKIKFLKGEEYREDRTLNIIPERPYEGTSSGITAPHREDLGYWFFREFGIPSPRSDWFRIVVGQNQTQQLLIEQVNECFLEINGLNPDGDLFKRNYVSPNWEAHNNLENGTKNIDNLTKAIRQSDQTKLHEALTTNLVMDEFLAYSVASVLSSNWDGFHNNHWMYLDPDTQKWQIIPWDLDKVWGYTDEKYMYAEMPIEFPLNGQARYASRSTGPVTGVLHRDEIFQKQYGERLAYEYTHTFSEEYMFAEINKREQFLLADLQLLEEQTGTKYDSRRQQIVESYQTIREFVQLRRAYLSTVLQTPVANWSLY